MRIGAAILIGIAAVASASAREPEATQEEKEAAYTAYAICLRNRTAALDDGVSDAETVGRAVALGCRPEQAKIATVLSQGAKRDRVRQRTLELMQEHEGQEAAEWVLMHRRRARLASPQPAPSQTD